MERIRFKGPGNQLLAHGSPSSEDDTDGSLLIAYIITYQTTHVLG